ncbi:hypothetical protein N2152v2_008840 [Parachlorella kessleri]
MAAEGKQKDSHLAGLGFSFTPIQIKLQVAKPAAGRPGSAGVSQQLALDRAVKFNLKQRRPGAAYSSPQQQAAQLAKSTDPARPHSASGRSPSGAAPTVTHLRSSWPAPTAIAGVDSAVELLQALKLQSGPPGGGEQPAAHKSAGLARLKEATLARRKPSNSTEVPLALQQNDSRRPEQHSTHCFATAERPWCAEQLSEGETDGASQESMLLSQAEQLLAGCAAGGAGEPHRIVSPRHMQLGSTSGLAPAEPPLDLSAAPATLSEALSVLGLLASEGAPASVTDTEHQPLFYQAVYLAPLWSKLRAVAVALAAKEEAGRQELRPLLRRLHHVRANLEYHKANLARGRSKTPPRQRAPGGEQPWLSGSAGSAASMHKRSRSTSPGRQLPPRPKVGPTSKETSELQVKLLSSLLPKLWLKLGLAALKHAAALTRLRQRLLGHVGLSEAGKLSILVVRAWKEAAVPSQDMLAVAEGFYWEMWQRKKSRVVQGWQAWAQQHRLQREQVERGLQGYHRRVKLSAVCYWRVYCQERHVERLQQALAVRWLSAWSKRKVFSGWRLIASRAALQKQAMLGRIAGKNAGRAIRQGIAASVRQDVPQQPRQLLTQSQALAATRNAFQSVKDYVAAAQQELRDLRGSLWRFGRQWQQQERRVEGMRQQQMQQPGSPASPDPPPLGSLQALLALLQKPSAGAKATSAPASPSHCTRPLLTAASQPHPLPQAVGWAAAVRDTTLKRDPSCSSPDLASARSPEGSGSPSLAPWLPGRHGTTSSPAGRLSPAYSPSRYASPTKLPSVLHPQAIQAELEGHTAAVAHITRELQSFEQEAATLQHQRKDLEAQQLAAQQQASACRDEAKRAQQAKQETAQALQTAIQRHTEIATECSALARHQFERQHMQAVGDEAEAKAAAHAAVEEQALVAIAVQKWTKKVEAIARELSQCHRSRQPVVAAQLKEARHHLAEHQQQAAELQARGARLQQEAQQAAERCEQALLALQGVQGRLIVSAEERQRVQQEIKGLMEAQERHAVAAVAKEQEAFAADQLGSAVAQQHAIMVERLKTIASQVHSRAEDAQQLQQRVVELQQLQERAADTVLAAARKPKSSKHQRSGPVEAVPQTLSPWGSLAGSPASSPPRMVTFGTTNPAMHLPEGEQQENSSLGQHSRDAAHVTGPDAKALQHLMSAASDSSDYSSLGGSPKAASPPAPRTLGEAAEAFHHACLLRHVFHALRHAAQHAQEQEAMARQHYAWQVLSKCLPAWRRQTVVTQAWLAAVGPALRRQGLLRRWASWVRRRQQLRACEEHLQAAYSRRLLRQGYLALLAYKDHQHWRDAVHEAVVRLRWRNMLRGWRRWARQQRVEEASLQRARAVYNKRLLQEAWRQWSWVAMNKALLRRVFQLAVELWQEEVGALLHTRNYQLMGHSFRAWQLRVLERHELRRQQILWNAAVAFREKQLLMAGMQAFHGQVQAAHNHRRLLALRAEMFHDWKRLAATSQRHWDWVLAANKRRRWLLQAALAAWRGACEETTHT